ncbi:MAG: hypothetical protein HXY26_00985 [Hydrogenophilaceae bacterium]|nr:hypothetical protein [Hydrogenophilaceae bacterium]
MKRPKTVDEYVDLVHQAVYEVDEFRTSMDYEPENAEMFGPFLEQLDAMVRQVYNDMVAGTYQWGMGEDLPYMPLVVKFGRLIPFQRLLVLINDTHKNGLDVA